MRDFSYCVQGSKNTYLVEVDIHALELEVRGAIVDTSTVETVLARDGLPEGGTNLVTLEKSQYFHLVEQNAREGTYALTGLKVNLLDADGG